tara:strand:+ start:1432 stop:3078 length:1647 start_codon:yes stop_codon:yes gene_type:complete
MFELYYKKSENGALFKMFEDNNLVKIQNYIPIYKRFFDLNDANYKSLNLNQPFNITSLEKTDEKYRFKCTIKSDTRTIKTSTFFKYSPLIDPIKYMIGKYSDLSGGAITSLPTLNDSICDPKILDPNNSAYVDSFFTYLTSNLLHTHNFIHGLDFYGSFLAINKNYEMNILDDIEYLNENKFFRENKSKLFDVNIDEELLHSDSFTRNYRKKLKISQKTTLSVDNMNNDEWDGVFEHIRKYDTETPGCVLEYNIDSKSRSNSTQSSECSSRSSNSSNQDSDDDSDGGSHCSEYSISSDVECSATLKNFPVQIICLEAMEKTMDSLLCEDLSIDEWSSCLFQIIMMLVTYQKMFNFTHNDLHTNNIMYNTTDIKFIIYKYNNQYYKVPTHGRLFKMIDFGRAIYTYKGNIICSDSFDSNGDAATQYNTEPYLNKNKPIINPNKSFDLCRLGCAIYDNIYDVWGDKLDEHPLPAMINKWCTDDKGRNILYKKCGEERYPEFKLYKMIARTVHNNVPSSYINDELFSDFKSIKKKIGKRRVINIDELPVYT